MLYSYPISIVDSWISSHSFWVIQAMRCRVCMYLTYIQTNVKWTKHHVELKLLVIQATCPESHAVAEKNTRDYGCQLKWYTKVHLHASMPELGSSSPSLTLATWCPCQVKATQGGGCKKLSYYLPNVLFCLTWRIVMTWKKVCNGFPVHGSVVNPVESRTNSAVFHTRKNM